MDTDTINIKISKAHIESNPIGSPASAGISKKAKDGSKVFKRKRVPISCAFCRKRKIKCDRKKPHCSSCVKTNTEEYCIYKKPTWAQDTAVVSPNVLSTGHANIDVTSTNSKLSIPTAKSATMPNIINQAEPCSPVNNACSSANPNTTSTNPGLQRSPFATQLPHIGSLLNTRNQKTSSTLNNTNSAFQNIAPSPSTIAPFMNDSSRNDQSSPLPFGQLGSANIQLNSVMEQQNVSNASDKRMTASGPRYVYSPIPPADVNAFAPYFRSNSFARVDSFSEKGYSSNNIQNQVSTVMDRNNINKPQTSTARTIALENRESISLENTISVPNYSQQVTFDQGKSDSTASSLSGTEKPSAVEREIQLLKDRLNRLQASLHITEFSNTKTIPSAESNVSSEKHTKPQESESLFDSSYNNKHSSNSSSHINSSNNDKYKQNIKNGNKNFINNGNLQTNNKSVGPSGYNNTNMGINSGISLNPNETLLDSLMKSMQTGEFLNFLNNNNNNNIETSLSKSYYNDLNNFVFSYPNTMSRKFNSEEAESSIDFRSFLSPRRLNALDGFVFDAQDLQMIRHPTFMECWNLYPNDFYIRSLFTSRAVGFKKFIDQFKLKVSENLESDSTRFITSNEENEQLIATSIPLTAKLSSSEVRCLRSCILVNNDTKKIVPEPINNAKTSYLVFDNETKTSISPFNPKYKEITHSMLKSLFSDIKEVLPNRKITYLLMHIYFLGISNFFTCLDKESTIMSITGNMDRVLFEDVSFDDLLKLLVDDSLTLTFDIIGIVLCILKIAFDTIADRITEHAYQSGFDSNCLSSTEKLIFESNINTTDYIHLAKRCFSYNFNVESVFHEFRKVHNGLRKVQLGLLIFGYQLSFEDRFHQASILFNSSNEEFFTNVEEFFPQLKEEKETAYEHMSMNEGSTAEEYKNPTNNDLLKLFSTCEACSIFSKCVSSSLTSFLHQLILFSRLLKLDHDPMEFSHINLTSRLVDDQSEIPNTIETIKLWRSVWLQMSSLDKGLASVLGTEPLMDHNAEKANKKIKEGKMKNYDGSRTADGLMIFESLDDKVYTNTLRRRAKCISYIIDPIIILNRKIDHKFKFDAPIKLNDYLSVIKSIDSFIEFNNDYSFMEIFQFVDDLHSRYPLFFKNYQNLSEEERTQYHNIELKSNTKCFEINNSLYVLMFSYGLMFNIYLNLFNTLDRVISFQKASRSSSIFKKVVMNTQEIINKVIKEVKKVVDTPYYRKFMLGKFKVLFRKGVEPLLFGFINHQLSLQIRIVHTINLLTDSLKRYDGSTTSTEDMQIVKDYQTRINLLERFLSKIIESIKEMFRLFEAINNMDKEPELNDLNDDQLGFYEGVNKLKYESTSWFSQEALLSVVSFGKIFSSLQFKSADGIFESKQLNSNPNDLFDVHDVKLKTYATSNGASIILPNFCSLLFFEGHEIAYITNDILKIFPGTFDVGPIVTPNEVEYVGGKFNTPPSPSDKSIFNDN